TWKTTTPSSGPASVPRSPDCDRARDVFPGSETHHEERFVERYQLKDMVKGWFVGDFDPTVLRTQAAEVAVKVYKPGDCDAWHYHKIATEVTVILQGRVRMNDSVYQTGDIITIQPNEGTDFQALEPTTTVVVKIPGAQNDKYTKRLS